MAGKRYRVQLNIDDSGATRPINKAAASFRKMESDALKALQAIERAALAASRGASAAAGAGANGLAGPGGSSNGRVKSAQATAAELAKIEDRLLKREYDGRVRFERQKEAQAERSAQRASAAAERLTQKVLREEEKKAEATLRSQRRVEASTTRLYTKEEAQRRAVNEKTRRANDKLVEDELRAMGVTGRRFANGWEGSQMLAAGVEKAAGAFGLLIGAGTIVGTIADEFDRATKAAIEGAKFTDQYRNSMLELAALKGNLGGTGQETRESFAFRAKTLQGRDEAVAFQKAALGVGQSAIDDPKLGIKGLISREEFAKAMELGGSFQKIEGGSAETHGALIGQIPMMLNKQGVTAEEVAAFQQKLYQVFQPGGADFTPMVQGFMKNVPLASAGLISPERLAAVESAFSVTNREGHAEQTQQFVRATVGGIGRMKGVKVEGDSMKLGEYLKGIGATDKMDPIQIGDLISGDLKAQQAAGRNPMTYLQSRGYGNMEDRQALLAFHGLKQSGQMANFEALAARPGDAAGALANIRKFQDADPAGLAAKARLAEEAGQVGAGAGPMEYWRDLMTTTFERMKQEGKTASGVPLSGKFEDIAGASSWNLLATSKQQDIFLEAARSLEAEAARVGLPPLGVRGSGFGSSTTAGQAERLYAARQRIGAAGGDLAPSFGAIGKTLDGILAGQNRQTDIIAKGQAQRGPLPLGVRPQAGAVRDP